MRPLTDFEKDVLRSATGETRPGLVWGAAMAEAAASLRSAGLFEGAYRLTPAGRAMAEKLRSEKP